VISPTSGGLFSVFSESRLTLGLAGGAFLYVLLYNQAIAAMAEAIQILSLYLLLLKVKPIY